MDIATPSAAEVEAIFADTLRYPEKASATVIGDGGKPQRLPLILGNPSGACSSVERVSPAWSRMVAATYRMREEADEAELVRDCLLYPPAPIWAQWVERWPALVDAVTPTLRAKVGWKLTALDEAPFDYETPPELAVVLARNPRAVLRVCSVSKEPIAIVLAAPRSAVWRMFIDAIRKKDADHWTLARDYASAVVLGVHGMPSADALIERWPGLALVIGLVASNLAGVTADVELGEW